MIEYEVSQKEIQSIVKSFNAFGSKITDTAVIEKIAVGIKERIIQRTQGGKDVRYNNFEKYSDKYRAKKGTSVVNLTNTSLMMNSMTQKVLSNDTVKIFFSNKDARDRANWHNKGLGNNPVREFFGVNIKDRESALKTYSKGIAKAKKDLGYE